MRTEPPEESLADAVLAGLAFLVFVVAACAALLMLGELING